VDKIHACSNHCILYRKELGFKMKCLVCGVSQYKRSYNHMYVDTMNKKNTDIDSESVDDENNSDKENNKKRDSCIGDVVPSGDRSFKMCVLQA
jgi:hypothetical protein